MAYRLTQKNITDLAELQKIVSESTYEGFKELAEKEYDGREGNGYLIEFDYECLTGTIDKENNCLCGTFDVWDDEGQWLETIRVEKVKFKEIKMNKLLKKLILVEEINTDNYSLGWKVFDYVVENPDCIISFENRNEWVKYNLTKKDTWITFGDMRTLRFFTKDSEVYVEVKVYKPAREYESFGYDLQWVGVFKLSIDFLDNIKGQIDNKFLKFCNDSYDDYLDSLREKWVNEFAEKMLAD